MTTKMSEDDPYFGSYKGGNFRGRSQSPEIEHAVCDEWMRILKILMEEKFIYQNVSLDTDVFTKHATEIFSHQALSNEFSRRPVYPLSDGKKEKVKASPDWMLSGAMAFDLDGKDEDQPLPFFLPSLQLQCKRCKGERTFSSLVDSRAGYLNAFLDENENASGTKQAYTLYYMCNGCDKNIILFQILRSGLKLQITGRSEPLRAEEGKWPKVIREIVGDAIQAVSENDIYAGFYHLRTAVEHYIKAELKIDAAKRINGEELGDMYKASLSEKVKTTAPSISAVYTELSECMHTRSGDISVFNSNMKKFGNHIQLKKLIEEF